VLHVEPDGNGGIMLAIQIQAGERDFILVALHPKMVLYCTHVHQARIVAP